MVLSCVCRCHVLTCSQISLTGCHHNAGCEDDEAVVSWLVKEHKVCVVPGSACGCPGYIRIAFANLEGDKCKRAAAQLKKGLQQLVNEGAKALEGAPVEHT